MSSRDMAQAISISVNSPQEFHKAHAALGNAGILVSSINPGGAIGPIGLVHGFSNINGWLQIDSSQLKRAEAILDELGIPNSLNARPIVDRSDPTCPACAGALDLQGPEICPHCQREFWWVDIDEPELDPTGRECRNCGYDLTGNQMQRCPECSHPVVADSYDLFEAANRAEHPSGTPTPNQRFTFPATSAKTLGFALVLIAAGAITLLTVLTFDQPSDFLSEYPVGWLGFVLLFIACTAIAASRLLRRWRGD